MPPCRHGCPRDFEPRCVAIAGGSASGKTTLARAIRSLTGAALLEQDAYYRDFSALPFALRQQINFDAPESVDLACLESHAESLCAGKAVLSPCYDFSIHARAPETRLVSPAPLVLLTGLHVLWLGFCARRALNVYLDAPDPVRLERRLARDTSERGRTREEVMGRWNRWVLPMHHRWVAPQRARADIVMDGTAPPEHNARLLLDLARLPL